MKYKWTVLRRLFFVIFLQAGQVSYPLAQSAGPDGCNAGVVHDLGYTGQGVHIGLLSLLHCRYTHEAFYDKDAEGNPLGDSHAHWYDATSDSVSPYEPSSHDTSMAGILASRGGKIWPDYRGMAPDAEVNSAKIYRKKSVTDPNRITSGLWFQNALEHFRQNQCRVVVTGLQLPLSEDAAYPFTLLYDYYAYQYDMIFANAAGNDSTSITIFGTAYNGITTAGLITTEPDVYNRTGTASNPGLTADGRQKPDIGAPAQNLWVPTVSGTSDTTWKSEGTERGQTSWSGPHAAGAAALLVDYADASEEPDDGHGVVIKAVIVNSAFPNIQDEYGNATTGQVWNRWRGYGRLDALRAFELLIQPKIIPDTPTSQTAGWAHQTLAPGQMHTYRISGIPVHNRLLATLTWHRRVRWIDHNPVGIINPTELTGYPADLDLEIDDPNGSPSFTDQLSIDNLEKADFLITQSGDYQIRVINKSSEETVAYALAYELLEPIPADFNIDYIVNSQDLSELAQLWLQNPCQSPDESCGRLDLVPDGIITLHDFNQFRQFWLTQDSRYYSLP
jgi:hypothetical protein